MMKSLLKLLGEPLVMNLVINFQSFGFAACGHWRVLVVRASGRSFGTCKLVSTLSVPPCGKKPFLMINLVIIAGCQGFGSEYKLVSTLSVKKPLY
jgi:hypothetical protein